MNECRSESFLLLPTAALLLSILGGVKLIQQRLNLHSHNLFFIQLGLQMHRQTFVLRMKTFIGKVYTAMKINLAKYSLNSKDRIFCGSEKLSKSEH